MNERKASNIKLLQLSATTKTNVWHFQSYDIFIYIQK